LRSIEGYVIVSADGMLADGKGVMPDSIKFDADQHFFQTSLDRAAVILHGRHSHEGGPRAAKRKRVVLTRQIATLAPDPVVPNATLWNPLGVSLDEALQNVGVKDGVVAVIGGPEVFSMFLPLYDAFNLSRAERATIPGGLPVFAEVGPNATVEDVLSRHGLKPGPKRDLDAAAGVSVTRWERKILRNPPITSGSGPVP
jgi:dihydrofolate reductase